MAHTVKAALERGELTEEEAYFVLRFAGRRGYTSTMRALTPWPKRLRKWFIWLGGWESPELCQWDLGWPQWRIRGSPTPVSVLGGWATFYGWGAQVGVAGGLLVWSARPSSSAGWRLYWSPDGTPGHARARCFVGRAG